MNRNITRLRDSLAEAKVRYAADAKSLEEVRELLAKADERRLREPKDARKWNRVLENLEESLDLTKARCERSELEVLRLERDLAEAEDSVAPATKGTVPTAEPSALTEAAADEWSNTMREVGALDLEEASRLQSKIDSGEIHDRQLEAGLALANQMHADDPEPAPGQEARRQLVLRSAIDKIRKQQFDAMTLDEVKLVLACHSLLTSRLEPTTRDQRLRRILDGAIKILQKRKAEMEGL